MITIPENIKSLLKSDSAYKNFRVHFPNGEREDITNDNIVSESVSLTESICSSQQLKIGMCETPSIEFETLGVGYIRGAEIECSLEVESPLTDKEYVLPRPYYAGDTYTAGGVTFTACGNAYTNEIVISGEAPSGETIYTIVDAQHTVLTLPRDSYYVLEASGLSTGAFITLYFGNNRGFVASASNPKMVFYTTPTRPSSDIEISLVVDNRFQPASDGSHISFTIKKLDIDATLEVNESKNGNLLIPPFVDISGRMVSKGSMNYMTMDLVDPWGNVIGTHFDCWANGESGSSEFVFYDSKHLNGYCYYDAFYDEGYVSDSAYLCLSDGNDTYSSIDAKLISIGDYKVSYVFPEPAESRVSFVPKIIPLTDFIYEQGYVEGTVHKEDIGKYVYPIPYGTFIVDSCKKQADMSHRQIIGYNKFAYNSWQLNRITREMFNAGFYWVDRDYTGVSIESVMRLMFPEMGTFEARTVTVSSQWLELCRFDDAHNTYAVKYRMGYVPISQGLKVVNYQIRYDENFLLKFNQMCAMIQEMGLRPLGEWLPTVSPMYPLNSLSWHSESSYYLTMPNSIASSITVDRWDFIDSLKSRNLCVPYIYHSKGSSDTYWLLNWKVLSNGAFYMYTQFQLINVSTSESLFDTDSYIPTVYADTTAPDLFTSPLNLYIPITNTKQKVNMVKSTSGTVQKTLYKYDLSVLNSINLKDLLQAYLEIQGKFGLITRDGNINFVSVNEAFNTPDDTIPKSDYYTLWYDDFPSKPYGRITASYKDSNGDDMFAYYDLVENFSDAEYKTYDISNNYFIKNNNYTEQQIQTILQTMGQNMTNISYMPMNVTMKGRPDLEAGDVVILNSDEQQITGFIMQRTIDGIQGLVDDIASQDDTDQSLLASLGTVYDEETGTLSLYLSESRR